MSLETPPSIREVGEAVASTGAQGRPGRMSWTRLSDLGALLGAWAVVLFFSGGETYTWLYTPDSEFYVTLSAFGEHITDRAPTDAYYWTKLGIIAPQYLVSHFWGFDVAHAVFRAALLLVIMGSAFAVARVGASRFVPAEWSA